jgi:hypothetical protein
VDGSDNIYITGGFTSPTINFGGNSLTSNGGEDVFLVKLDNSGNHLWSKNFGGDKADKGNFVAIDGLGNVYIAGIFESASINFGGNTLQNAGGCNGNPCADIFLAKFNSSGNHIWSKRFGGTGYDNLYSIAIDKLNNVYIVGNFHSPSINFGGSDIPLTGGDWSDVYIAKFDSSGIHLWSKGFGGSYIDGAMSVAIDSSNNVYMTGWFSSSNITFGGPVFTNSGSSDIFLVKFDANGNHIWSRSFGGSGADEPYVIALDKSNNVYLSGLYTSSSISFGGNTITNTNPSTADIFLVKLDSNGTHLWSKGFGGSWWDYTYGISVEKSNNVIIGGMFTSQSINFGGDTINSSGNFDAFFAKFDSNGNHICSRGYGGGGYDYGYSVAVDSAGSILLYGQFERSVDFGVAQLTSSGFTDVFILKSSP